MPSARAFPLAARLATTTSVLMFGLIVVGSVVRTTGSGLSCPDWPLCQGRLFPPLQFNVMLEWFHRLLALCVGLLLFATALVIALDRQARARLGGVAALAVALYFAQALLGALTVWRLLDPSIVSGHLAVGLLLFGTLLAIALIAHHESLAEPAGAVAERPPGLLPVLGGVTLLAYLQSVLGGMVSTNHASLACPDWPKCNGEWFPPMTGLVALQVSHRFGAYLLTIAVGFATWRAMSAPDPVVRFAARLLPSLVVAQVALGVCTVLLGVPVWLSALHLAHATSLLAIALVATFRVAAMPARASQFAPAVAS